MSTSFHHKMQIVRPGREYRLAVEALESTLRLFLSQDKVFTISIGSAADDYVHIEGLAPRHLVCELRGREIIVEAGEAVTVAAGRKKHQLKAGERLAVTSPREDLGQFSHKWKVAFANGARISGKLWEEKEKFPPQLQQYLESRYGALEKIAEGDSSVIFRTENRKVLKILRPSYARNKRVVARFINTARKFYLLPREDFLHIERVLYDRRRSLCYVEMEHFPGELLENVLAKKGMLPLPQVEEIVVSLAQQLATLQSKNYCCRNLRPKNILYREDGVRITSFFLMKLPDLSLTMPGDRLPSTNYTAPEQQEAPSDVDITTDMFSLGAIFYHLATGKPVPTPQTADPEELQRCFPHIPGKTWEIIVSLLSPDPQKRPTPWTLLHRLSGKQLPSEVPVQKSSSTGDITALSDDFIKMVSQIPSTPAVDDVPSLSRSGYDSNLSLKTVLLLKKIDRILENEEETKEDAETELSEDEISRLQVLEISHARPAAADPDISVDQQQLQNLYRQAEEQAQARSPVAVSARPFQARAQARRQFGYLFFSFVLAIGVAVAGGIRYLFTAEVPVRESSLILEEPEPPSRQPANEEKRTTPLALEDPAAAVVKEVCRSLFRHTAPSQELLNRLLKHVYLKRLQFPQSADLYNLLGRLLWYKIHLDRQTRFFGERWLVKWEEEARRAWQKSRELYEEQRKPVLKLAIEEWMPEKKVPGYEGRRLIEYDSIEEASADVNKLLQTPLYSN